MDLDTQINTLYKKGDWSDCEKYLNKALEINPESFWYWTTLSSVTYEQRKYNKAKEYSEMAFSLNPESPLVWWDYAAVLYMLDEDEKAIQLWKNIIGLGIDEIGLIRTKEGKSWAARLINDCYYHLAKALCYNENYIEAKSYLQRYSEHLLNGVDSIFDTQSVEKLTLEINDHLL